VVLEGKPAAITPELGGDNIPSSQNFTPVKNYPSWFQDPLESLPGNWQSGMTVINTIPKISPVPERRSPAAERLQYGWEGSVGRVSPRLNTIQLTVVNGPDAGLVFTSTADSIVIGRERSCDVVLHDSGVSRRHCIVHDKKGIFEVIDLHTPNGTFLNNSQTRISAHVLKDGDELTVGKSRLRITLPVSDKKRVMTVELEEGDLAARQIPAHSYDSPSWVMGPGESLPENWQSGMTMMGAVPKMPPVSQNPAPTAELPTYKRKGILARLTARWRRLVWALKAPLP
jgi:pSer/pThr/pTyr-binding forkhead associated (FHA) protein